MGIRVAILLCALASALSAQTGELFWHESYESAIEEARKTGKPIFLEYRCSP